MYYFEKWLKRQDQRHSGKSKFRQNGSYSKKEKDSNRDDWRERKGFSKDQSKHRTWCKCGRYLKSQGNRLERRYVKRQIHHEKYDEIYYHQDMWVSSWDAC